MESTEKHAPVGPPACRDVLFRLLGPLVVEGADGRSIPVGPPRQRACLAAFLVFPGQGLSIDRLTELLWEGAAPPTARTMVHAAVGGLRRVLEPHRAAAPTMLVTEHSGYVLDVAPSQLDSWRFERLVDDGRRAVPTAPARAAGLLGEALELWRGPALHGLEQPFARQAATGWEELRLDCTQARVEAELALGRHQEVVPQLEDLVRAHPFRERLCALLVTALYRCGRQADALARLRATRRALAEELGVAPGPELRRLEQAVLEQRVDLARERSSLPGPRSCRRPPASFDAFVGRAEECGELAVLLSRHRLVTLTGPGGVGKTRLAAQVCRAPDEDGSREVRWADLAPLTAPDLLGETVADALGVHSASGPDLVETIAAAVAGRAVTLVLDNCEHLAEPCAGLAQSLLTAAPDMRLLATSREALRVPGEQVYPVPPLRLTDATDGWQEIAACEAVELFVRRASSARPGFAVSPDNARLVLEVCRRLDGLPFALELAAARSASLPLPDLAARLDGPSQPLDAAARASDARHRSLAATLAWSLDLLDEAARRLLVHVSVFPAAFTVAAAEQVVADDGAGGDVGLLLARLVESSCLQLEDGPDGQPRFRMLQTTRQYAGHFLGNAARAVLRERHARCYLALAEEARPHLLGPGSAPWLARLHAEHDNFRAALEWAFDPEGDPHVGGRLIGCLWHLWDVRGARGEGLHWVRAGLHAGGPGAASERLPMLSAGALFSLGRAEFAEVAEFAGEQLALARDVGAFAWEGDALAMQATVAWAHGRYDRARHLYEDAVAASLAGGDVWRAALAEAQLARLHRDRDEPDAARAVVLRALEHAEEVGEEVARGLAVDVLASVEQRWGDDATARRLAEQALRHYRAVGYLEGEASARCTAGQVALSAGELDRARQEFAAALRSCRRIGHRGGCVAALEGLAQVASTTGDDQRAVLLLGSASALRAEIGIPVPGGGGVRQHLTARLGAGATEQGLRRGAGLPLDELLPDDGRQSAHG